MNRKNKSGTLSTNDNKSPLPAPPAAATVCDPLLYYPPRAGLLRNACRWRYSFRRRFQAWKQRAGLEWIPQRLCGSIFLPGYAYLPEKRRVGLLCLLAYASCALVFILFLGYSIANWAFASMFSLHVASVAFFLTPRLSRLTLGRKLLLALALMVLLGQFIYMPGRKWMESNFALPVRKDKQVLVLNPRAKVGQVNRGDWIVFQISGSRQGHIVTRDGYGWSPVYGLSGDVVRFRTNSFEVAGVTYPRRPFMPKGTEWVVPADRYFVWPMFESVGAVVESEATAVLYQKHALISGEQFVGQPFRRWFWRKQTL